MLAMRKRGGLGDSASPSSTVSVPAVPSVVADPANPLASMGGGLYERFRTACGPIPTPNLTGSTPVTISIRIGWLIPPASQIAQWIGSYLETAGAMTLGTPPEHPHRTGSAIRRRTGAGRQVALNPGSLHPLCIHSDSYVGMVCGGRRGALYGYKGETMTFFRFSGVPIGRSLLCSRSHSDVL